MAHRAVNNSITIMSCMINIHIDSLPKVLSVFHISSSNFNITIVLLNANPTHIYHAVIGSNQSNIDIQNHSSAVIIT